MASSQLASSYTQRLTDLPAVAPARKSRWLISKDRQDDALQVMAKYYANDDVRDGVIMFEFAEIKEAIKEEKVNSKGRYLDLINSRGYLSSSHPTGGY